MTVNELKAKLKGGTPAGWYVFCGDESFLKRHYLGELRRAVLTDPATDAFNHIVLEGSKLDFPALESALEAPPMMADCKLIEWHLLDFSALKEADLGRLIAAAEAYRGATDTAVVFVADADRLDVGNLPKRPSRLYTALSGAMDVVVFEKSGDAALAGWIARHLAHNGVEADAAVIHALLERSGRSMDALSGEIEKLSAYVLARGRTHLTREDVELVACANGEEDAFGLANAILDGRAEAAYACLRDMKLRRVEPTLALGSVSRVWSDLLAVAALSGEGMGKKEIATRLKMHEYKAGLYLRCAEKKSVARLEAALRLCRRADLAAKNRTGADGYLMLELLIAETLG